MADQGMPSTYETSTTTHSSSPTGVAFHPEYLRTLQGILKIVEIVLGVLVLICTSIVGYLGGGWVFFVAISCFVTTLVWLILYVLGLRSRLPTIIVIVVLDLIVFICAIIPGGWWVSHGGGWVQFVSIVALLSTGALFVIYLLGLRNRLPPIMTLIEFIYYAIFTVFYLIAAIVAAARGSAHSAIGATAFFAFAATAVYAVDTFFQFKTWRSGTTETVVTSSTTTTTTTSSNVEAKAGVY